MGEHKHALFFNAIILVICFGIGLYILYDLSYSWPHNGCTVWFILLFLAPIFLYHGISISHFLLSKKPLIRKKTISLVSLIFGILFAGGLLQLTQHNSLQRFSRIYAPMIEKIQKNLPEPCDEAYFEMPDIKSYNSKAHRSITKYDKPVGGLLYNKNQFILYFLSPSINVDRSTLFYDSTVKKWQLFQNDNLQAKGFFEQRRLAFLECTTKHFSPPITETTFP
ncbi:MAG: hypothetical protein KAG10_10220 [Methylococcales bacterium]|nr:hypothetical protein [Methylococcales bacterium]MCK5926258.1 hypothetical protein [Methylococcales bacterium]